jgi:SAM-dependent methyltransferase
MSQTITQWLIGGPSDLIEVSNKDRKGKPLRAVLNLQTGLIRNDPIPTDAELSTFYSTDYRVVYKGASIPRKQQAFRNFRRAAAHIDEFADVIAPAQSVLDVGAGSGEFLFLVRAIGKSGVGLEPNEGYSRFCREEYGLDVQTSAIESSLFNQASFDLIRLNHVLEHLNDPIKYLSMISNWLKPGGVLYVEVPNIESYCMTKSKGGLFHYGHIFNYSPSTLRAVAALAGLKEHDLTMERSKGSTGVFFVADGSARSEVLENRAHAESLKTLLESHASNGPAQGVGTKLLRKLGTSFYEFVNTRGNKSFSDIGSQVVGQMGEGRRASGAMRSP